MKKLVIGLLCIPTTLLAQVDSKTYLFSQAQLGEKTYNNILTHQALERLDLISPNGK